MTARLETMTNPAEEADHAAEAAGAIEIAAETAREGRGAEVVALVINVIVTLGESVVALEKGIEIVTVRDDGTGVGIRIETIGARGIEAAVGSRRESHAVIRELLLEVQNVYD
jgi:hypothetical protein